MPTFDLRTTCPPPSKVRASQIRRLIKAKHNTLRLPALKGFESSYAHSSRNCRQNTLSERMRKGKVENKLDVVSQDDLFPRDLSIKEESFSTIEDGK